MGARVQVPNNEVDRIWVIVFVVHVLGKYMNIGYVDPKPCNSGYKG